MKSWPVLGTILTLNIERKRQFKEILSLTSELETQKMKVQRLDSIHDRIRKENQELQERNCSMTETVVAQRQMISKQQRKLVTQQQELSDLVTQQEIANRDAYHLGIHDGARHQTMCPTNNSCQGSISLPQRITPTTLSTIIQNSFELVQPMTYLTRIVNCRFSGWYKMSTPGFLL